MALPYGSPFILSLLVLVSVPALLFVGPRLLPPKRLPAISDADEADDLVLLRRATLAASDPSLLSSFRRATPKVAFLFLMHSGLPFAPLWEEFFRGHEKMYNVYVHADPSLKLQSSLLSSPVFKNRFIPSKTTERASPKLISATRRLLAAALIDDQSNAFFAIVSESCIPLHSFQFVYNTMLSSHVGGRGRHRSFIEILDNEPQQADRYVARGDGVMMPEVPFEKFRIGSQFFVLTRRHAVIVVRDRRLWKKFRVPCLEVFKYSCYPEESYFPTLLDMEDPKGCTRYTLTRVNWTDSVGGHPHLYRPPEVTSGLISELRHSNGTYSYLFARKFSPDCLKPLMKIANSVIFRD